jgi:hypothetical protein
VKEVLIEVPITQGQEYVKKNDTKTSLSRKDSACRANDVFPGSGRFRAYTLSTRSAVSSIARICEPRPRVDPVKSTICLSGFGASDCLTSGRSVEYRLIMTLIASVGSLVVAPSSALTAAIIAEVMPETVGWM